MRIEGKRVILTGAASGIGRAVLKELAPHAGQILAADINGALLEESIGRAQPGRAVVHAFQGDLADQMVVDQLFEQATEVMGGADIFIANAGQPYYERTRLQDWDHIADIFTLNAVSTLYAYQKMAALAGEADYRFVLVSSAMAHMAMPGYALYSATKAALHRFAEAARLELERPERLMVVYPIATRTRFFEAASASTPVPWPSQSAEQVARKIIQGIRRDQMSVYPSRTFALILFLDRFQPVIRRLYQRNYLKDLLEKKE